MKNQTSGSNQIRVGACTHYRGYLQSLPRTIFGAVTRGVFACVGSMHGDTAVQWTFEQFTTTSGQTTGPYAPEVNNTTFTAAASLSGVGTVSAPSGNGSAHSYSANGWVVGSYFQFSLNASNYTNIFVSFDQYGSSSGPKDFALLYSTNGTTFTNFSGTYNVIGSPTISPSTFNPVFTHTFDLSGITDVNNASTLVFRLVDQDTTSIGNGTVAAAGTDRVDNFTVAQVPEPATVLGGVLLLGAASWSHRRRLVFQS